MIKEILIFLLSLIIFIVPFKYSIIVAIIPLIHLYTYLTTKTKNNKNNHFFKHFYNSTN